MRVHLSACKVSPAGPADIRHVGVDFGGSGMRVAAGSRLLVRRFAGGIDQAPEKFLLDTLAERLMPYPCLQSIGVALPMTLIGTGARRRLARQQSKFVPFSAGVRQTLTEIECRWQARLGAPVHIINDADAAAFHLTATESTSDAGASPHTAVVMLGTSLGVSYIIRRAVHFGPFSSNASHTAMAATGPLCSTCNQVGCWKVLVGADARDALALALGLRSGTGDTAMGLAEIAAQARSGSNLALEWMNTYAARLAYGLGQLLQFIPVNRVVLAGGVIRHCPGLTPLVRKLWRSGRFIPADLASEVRLMPIPWLTPARGAQHFAREAGAP